jgi:hypothetical protein
VAGRLGLAGSTADGVTAGFAAGVGDPWTLSSSKLAWTPEDAPTVIVQTGPAVVQPTPRQPAK